MKPQLPATETILARYADLDAWPPGDMLAAMWEAQLAAVAAVRPALPAIEAACVAAAARLATSGRLVMVGAGTSGRIGAQDGAELPPTFNWPPERLLLLMAGGDIAFTKSVENAEDNSDAAIAAIATHQVGQNDVVIGLAASGSTPFTTAAIVAARAAGALTIGMSNSAGGALLTAAEHAILVETGGEVIAGSTRMKAGTAQKVVLNLLSSTVMVLLGHVHRGLMVDMQAKNAKLRSRALRMLRALTDCDDDAAAAALSATDGRIKPAVLVVHGLDATAATQALARHSGVLRRALQEIGR
jgi:N-acetylmuramic acid 6-phosphate etherase